MGIEATKIGIAHCFGTGDTESLIRLLNFALIQRIGRALRVLLEVKYRSLVKATRGTMGK